MPPNLLWDDLHVQGSIRMTKIIKEVRMLHHLTSSYKCEYSFEILSLELLCNMQKPTMLHIDVLLLIHAQNLQRPNKEINNYVSPYILGIYGMVVSRKYHFD